MTGSRDPVDPAPTPEGTDAPAGPGEGGGPIAWMARHRVAANLLMLVLLIGGLIMLPRLAKEVFPRVTLDLVTVEVPYPGASPEEIEDGVLRAIEEEVRAIEGVEEVESFADESSGLVAVELMLGADRNQLLADVENAVRGITSFPEESERPIISLATNRQQVLSLILHGPTDVGHLRSLAEEIRDELIELDEITLVELAAVRPHEISVEVSRDELRRRNLTLASVAQLVRSSSIDLPAGDVETDAGEVRVRTAERRETAEEYRDIVLQADPDGGQVVRLGEIAEIEEGFQDLDRAAFYDGERAIRIDVYRVGRQTPLEVAGAARQFAKDRVDELPEGLGLAVWNDISTIYEDRVGLLLRNGYLGLALVLLVLALFLEPRLAFWVTLGIPISFLGAILPLPAFDVSINIISLFSFIIVLGLVVDDAIVVGEAIYRRQREGASAFDAAIGGAREVARPVMFSIATTCIAFTPMLFVPGVSGEFFRNIPIVVILVLLGSLVEALLILPAHLSHPMPRLLELLLTPFLWLMARLRSDDVSDGLERAVDRRYVPAVRLTSAHRYLTLAVGVALLLVAVGLRLGGRLDFSFLPRIEDDEVSANLTMPVGTPLPVTRDVLERLEVAARKTAEEAGDPEMVKGVYAQLGLQRKRDQESVAPPPSGSHVAMVTVDLVSAADRDLPSSEFVARWRERVGQLPGAETIVYTFSTGATAGAPINLRLTHEDRDRLEAAASEIADALASYAGVVDVDDGFTRGKPRLDVEVTPEGRAAGLTATDLAQELRGAFFGLEAFRFQRGRNEVRVYVRLPEEERRSLEDVRSLVLPLAGGGEMALSDAARITRDRAFTSIERYEMNRSVNVTADVTGTTNANRVMRRLRAEVLPEVEERYPGLRHMPGGQQQRQGESIGALLTGFAIAIVVMYAILAVAFGSYLQPLIVLVAIPFGFVGAVGGHLLLGYGLSLSSMFGLVALSGVVVNDSLLMVVAINELREGGASRFQAVVDGAARRVRPILMTSLTTFFGLMPMIFETSVQAKFLVPMAISLGFGILFATFILVFIVPALYLAFDDGQRLVAGLFDRILPSRRTHPEAASPG